MGYVSEIVQSGLSLADRQVGQYVEKARGYERLDALIDLASQRGPDVVKRLDEKVDLVIGGVSDRKTKALERYNGAVEFVQQKKGDALERYNGAKELLEQKKDGAMERYNDAKELLVQKKGDAMERYNGAKELLEQKKDGAINGAKELLEQAEKKVGAVEHYNGAVEFVQRKKGDALDLVQKKKDEGLEFVQEKKENVQSLAQEHLPPAAQARLSQLQVQLGLLVGMIVAQYRGVLDLPLSMKQRIERAVPELKQQYSASLETAKSWAAERLASQPYVGTGIETAKTWVTAVYADAKDRVAKSSEMAQAQYAAALTKAYSLLKQLPSYRERAAEAARNAVAWVKTRVPAKQD